MCAVVIVPFGDLVAVGKQDREARLVAFHPNPVARQDIGTVGEEGDAAKAFRLALRAEHSARREQAHQLAVGRGVHLGNDADLVFVTGEGDQQVGPVHRPAMRDLAIDFD